MADYNPHRAASWNYGGKNWKLSRSKIELFLECPKCFYIDNKLGTKQPPLPSFQINKAVDNQLKNEFDTHRTNGNKHPFQKEYGIDAIPAKNENLDVWRDNFQGVDFFHEKTGLLVSGAIDDLWVKPNGEHIVVDYKATAKEEPVSKLEGKWHDKYKKQVEVYQWLLRRRGLKVSDTAYFVYCTGIYEQKAFDKKIEFDVVLIPYEGSDDWVEPTLFDIKKCLEGSKIPASGPNCDYCKYREAVKELEE